MHNLQAAYVPWLVLAFALIAWGAVGYFAWSVSGAEAARVSRQTALAEEAAKFESDLRMHAIARETREERAALEKIARTDLLSIVEAIEMVGEDADVRVGILQIAAGDPISAASPDVPTIRPVNAVVEAQGAFGRLVHAAALLQVLPFPSEVYQMQFERIPPEAGGSAGGWRFVARIRVLTTADISS